MDHAPADARPPSCRPAMTEAFLWPLNTAQRRAVTSDAPTLAILAGPGSGKTHTLTSRVAWLVQHRGYAPCDVIVATFTVKAAQEMKARITAAVGEKSGRRVILGTFHAIARRYLAKYGDRIGLDPRFGIADDGDSRAIIQRLCRRLGLNIEPSHAKAWISKTKSAGASQALARPGRRLPDSPALKTCFQHYQAYLASANLLDYDDLLVRCARLLRDQPSCVSNIQAVLIDEYQDTNGIQYDLMKLFAQACHRITIVGDPDQSIYGWRSAEVHNLYRLLRDFPRTDEVSLEENYRSSQLILDLSLQVIQQDTERYKKTLVSVHCKGAHPVLRRLKSSVVEGEWIVSEIRRAIILCGGMLKPHDVVILLRSASLSRHVESALGKAGMPYRMVGGHKFYDRKEIKLLLDYLRVVYQPSNNDALARIINVPRRGIGEATIRSLIDEAEQADMSLWALLWRHCRQGRKAKTNIRPKMEQKLNTGLLTVVSSLRDDSRQTVESSGSALADLVHRLVGLLDLRQFLKAEYAEDYECRWVNVQELLQLAADFSRDHGTSDDETLPIIEGVAQTQEDHVLGRFLANVALASDAQKKEDQTDGTSMMTISTIHAAKGLEWPVVFVPSVYTGSIPHSRAEDTSEERRLLYVAMTRAQTLLCLSYPLYASHGGGNKKLELSPFVSPMAHLFAQKGPSFDRAVVEGAAKILGRVAPTEMDIYNQLPPMFPPEDDLFPIEPWEQDSDVVDNGTARHVRGTKRQRTVHCYVGNGDEGEKPWKPDYTTTMEKAFEFTMASLPGFTSASTYQSALAATATAATGGGQKGSALRPQGRAGTSRRRPDQRSLLGFVTVESKAANAPAPKTAVAAAEGSLRRHQAAAWRHMAREELANSAVGLPQHSIAPGLAQHKLASGSAASMRPPAPKRADDEAPRRPYGCFSSSPPRCPSPNEEKKASQPAASFHTTTFTSAAARRPAGLGPRPSMERLRKPFKPLSISRPSANQAR